MKISKKLQNLKELKLEICGDLKEEMKRLKDSKEEDQMTEILNMWQDIHIQIEEMDMMIESLQINSR